MNRQELVEGVALCLATLAYALDIENSVGMYSRNVILEDILLPVFRILFSAKDLDNANSEMPNVECIDLYSPSLRLGIQVTTESRQDKVEATLLSLKDSSWKDRLDRLVFQVLTPKSCRRTQATIEAWQLAAPKNIAFDPKSDVLEGVPSLMKLIRLLDDGDLIEVYGILNASILGNRQTDVFRNCLCQATQQLEYEKLSLKYIPEIFVETPRLKEDLRIFCHPSLFFGRICDQLNRYRIGASLSRMEPFGYQVKFPPDLDMPVSEGSLPQTIEKAELYQSLLMELKACCDRIVDHGGDHNAVALDDETKRSYYNDNGHIVRESAYFLSSDISDIVDKLSLIRSRVLLLTSKAGQGKTMFICDFVENFLLGHAIPCFFFSGRLVSTLSGKSLCDSIKSYLGLDSSLSDSNLLELLNKVGESSDKPFVIVIDAINEHFSTSRFSQELHKFVSDCLPFTNIRFIFTCRSEFFSERFSSLVSAPLNSVLIHRDKLGLRLYPNDYDELIENHFSFFNIPSDIVANEVLRSFEEDKILLRIFCEAYQGLALRKTKTRITSLYRLEVFALYFKKKVSATAEYRSKATNEPFPACERKVLKSLKQLMCYMVGKQVYAEIPYDAIDPSLHDILDYLVGEEILLRKDLARNIPFDRLEDTLSFTFDELRDYLLATYIASDVFPKDTPLFDCLLASEKSTMKPYLEGVKRFLFHISRSSKQEDLRNYTTLRNTFESCFIPEIFNTNSDNVTIDDVNAVQDLLSHYESANHNEKDGNNEYYSKAYMIVKYLMARVRSEYYPRLNLRFLLDISLTGNGKLRKLIRRQFEPYFDSGYNLKSYCTAIEKAVVDLLNEDVPDHEHATTLSYWLLVLLPLKDANSNKSFAELALSNIVSQHPQFGYYVLDKALEHNISEIKIQVWRIINTVFPGFPFFFEFCRYSERDLSDSDIGSNYEVKRYLDMAQEIKNENSNNI